MKQTYALICVNDKNTLEDLRRINGISSVEKIPHVKCSKCKAQLKPAVHPVDGLCGECGLKILEKIHNEC